jgi:hypothetical protein
MQASDEAEQVSNIDEDEASVLLEALDRRP